MFDVGIPPAAFRGSDDDGLGDDSAADRQRHRASDEQREPEPPEQGWINRGRCDRHPHCRPEGKRGDDKSFSNSVHRFAGFPDTPGRDSTKRRTMSLPRL